MKLFISWSGHTSQELAHALHGWIPNVLQNVKPFISSEDIESGARWHAEIGKELETTDFGILCITRVNLHAPWLNFEAGALSKFVERSRVVPLLFDMRPAEVQGPLAPFNMRQIDKAGIKHTLHTLNTICGPEGIDDNRLDNAFNVWWPTLEQQILALQEEPNPSTRSEPIDPVRAMLEELLELARSQQKVLSASTVQAQFFERILQPLLIASHEMDAVMATIPRSTPAADKMTRAIHHVGGAIGMLKAEQHSQGDLRLETKSDFAAFANEIYSRKEPR